MLDLYIVLIFTFIIMTPIMVSFIMLIKDAFTSPSFFEYQLLASCITLIFWTLLAIPIYLTPELFTFNQIVLIEHFTTIIGSAGVLFFIFAIINTFSYRLVLIPRLAVVGFSIIIGTEIVQLQINPEQTIYGIKLVNGQLERITPPLLSLMIFLAYASLYASLILFIKYQNSLPSYIVANKIKQYSILSLLIMTIGIFFQSVGTLLIKDAIIAGFTLILARLFITSGFIFIVLQFTQNPILSFSQKGNKAKFLLKGLINWIIVENGALGPETLKRSKSLDSYFKPDELQLFSIKLMTSINLGNSQYREDLCIIPYSTDQFKLVAIGFSFLHKDPEITDNRKKNKTELLFAIIIPEILLPFLENLNIEAMRAPILSRRDQTTEIKEFMATVDFDSLTLNLIKNLNSKQVF